MLLLEQDTTNIIYFSLKDKATTGTKYLVVFINDMTKVEYSVLLTTPEDVGGNLSIAFIKDMQSSTPDNLSGEITFKNTGYYAYEIYEQSNGTNLSPTDAAVIGMIERGKAYVKGTDEIEYTEHIDTTNTTNYLYINDGTSVVWQPTDESSIVAWYKKDTGITHSAGAVSEWADSANSYDMAQDTSSEQPTYASNTITFDGDDNLQTTSQITLTGEFTIGLKMRFATTNGTFLGDNTTTNELFKIQANNLIRVKNDNGLRSLYLSGSDIFGDDYIVIYRDSSNIIHLYRNGSYITSDIALSGNILIDAIGARAVDTNNFTGDITEIQIYSSTSTGLINNINSRLSTL